jgi:hypothetical protein
LQSVADKAKLERMTKLCASSIERLPGAELVLPGLIEAAAGQLTVGSCLVSIARPLIESSGLAASYGIHNYVKEPERALYRLLQHEGGNAYGCYNAILRRLISFEQGLRRVRSRED